MLQFLWWLFRVLLAALAFISSALMLRRLWEIVPVALRRSLRNGLAVVFVILGIIGWILPVMPGFVFWLLALGVVDVPHKRAALRRLQHSRVVQRFLQSPSFAKSWRTLRRHARNAAVERSEPRLR